MAVVWTITNPQVVDHFRDLLELCWNVDCEVLIEARLDGTAVGERREVVASRYEKTNANRIKTIIQSHLVSPLSQSTCITTYDRF